MARTSARDRLEALRLEAEIKAKEKEAARAARDAAKASGKSTSSSGSRSSGSSGASGGSKKTLGRAADVKQRGRVKIVWQVCDPGGKEVKSFPYAQEQEARAEAAALTTSTGKTHFVGKAEVPFS
ncbi:MAG: hypothetical protein IPK26_10870 [Planctomycetes bacterium]|nr:hypothetical protein [Planctomycetota bacterium]